MKFIRKAIKVGNSAGVLLPKKLLGSEVKIIVVKRLRDIKKEVFNAIGNDLQDVLGIYVTSKNPAEVIVISFGLKKILERKDLKIIFVPLNIVKKDIKTSPNLKAKLTNAEAIMNRHLLNELLSV